jgi:hypothetical protein
LYFTISRENIIDVFSLEIFCKFTPLRLVYIGNVLSKRSVTATDTVLALATLADATEIESFLFYAANPKVAKASTLSVAVADVIVLNFANENKALK